MPLALRELQAAFVAHVTGADDARLVAEVTGDTIAAAARLGVYRHHVFESLGTALAATFPTVQALVGADFFRRLARDFVGQSLPTQPVLAEYGADLPRFIDAYQPARGLPYLADMARLEWALNVAFQAPEGRRLKAEDLSDIAAERLPSMSMVFAAGTALIRSPYPLDRIWQASQPDAAEDAVDLNSGAADLLVLRRSQDAAYIRLVAAEAAFVEGLMAGGSLEAAAASGLKADASFDLSGSFARLMASGVFVAVQ